MGAPWAMAALLWFGTGVPTVADASSIEDALAPAQKPASVAQKQAAGPQKPATAGLGRQKEAPGGPVDIRITSPTPDDAVSGRVRVRAEVTAAEPKTISAVDFFIDGRLMFSDAEAPYELMWRSGRPAEHRIEVRAYGLDREVASDSLITRLTQPAESLGGFRARVERVEVHARVEDEETSLPGVLSPDLFEVLENGVAQPVMAVERVADLPLAVGILVDHSGSMLDQLDTSLGAATAFVDGLLTHPNDKAFLLGFADIPIVFQEFTNDTGRLANAIEMIDDGDSTVLFDAIVAAAERFAGSDGRRAVILLTDGSDQGSDHAFREAIAAARPPTLRCIRWPLSCRRAWRASAGSSGGWLVRPAGGCFLCRAARIRPEFTKPLLATCERSIESATRRVCREERESGENSKFAGEDRGGRQKGAQPPRLFRSLSIPATKGVVKPM